MEIKAINYESGEVLFEGKELYSEIGKTSGEFFIKSKDGTEIKVEIKADNEEEFNKFLGKK